ncbi:MAG: hypothetical protein QM811_18150 [Pirellulales bacterium]
MAAANIYTGPTTITAGKLIIDGDQTLSTGAVGVATGAILAGAGIIGGTTTINAGGTVAPGNSPGTLSFVNGVSFASGSTYAWELFAATDGNAPSGVWDRISVNGGVLNIAGGAILVPTFGGTATAPTAGTFWAGDHVWNDVIDVTGTATIDAGSTSAFAIDNSAWSALGAFSTVPAANGQGVDLVWTAVTTAVPEPGTWAGAFAAVAGLAWLRTRRRAA